jgi:hypothetical protein
MKRLTAGDQVIAIAILKLLNGICEIEKMKIKVMQKIIT